MIEEQQQPPQKVDGTANVTGGNLGVNVGVNQGTILNQSSTNHKALIIHWLHTTLRVPDRQVIEKFAQAILDCECFDVSLLKKHYTAIHLCTYLVRYESEKARVSRLQEIIENHFKINPDILQHCWNIYETFRTAIEVPEAGTIRNCYRKSLQIHPQNNLPVQQEQDAHDLFATAVFILAEFGKQTNDTHPVASFVNLVKPFVDAECQTRFADWLRTVKDQFGWKASADEHSSDAQQSERESVLIRFKPENMPNCEPMYSITAWHHKQQGSTVIYAAEEPCPIRVEALPVELAAVLKEHFGRGMRVELILPVGLLPLALEQWELSRGKRMKTRFGSDYEVILRSHDRLYDPDYQDEEIRQMQRARWKAWKEQRAHPCFCPLHGALSNLDDAHASVALTFHLPTDEKGRDDVFWNLFDAGVPIILFPRATYPKDGCIEVQPLIEQLVAELDESKELPTVLFKKRTNDRDPDSPVHHIALIWDDPDWLPPRDDDTQLVAA